MPLVTEKDEAQLFETYFPKILQHQGLYIAAMPAFSGCFS